MAGSMATCGLDADSSATAAEEDVTEDATDGSDETGVTDDMDESVCMRESRQCASSASIVRRRWAIGNCGHGKDTLDWR